MHENRPKRHKKSRSQERPGIFLKGLLTYHFKFNLGLAAVAEINFSFKGSQFLNIINDRNAATVNFITFLFFNSPGYLNRCYTTEDLSAGAGFSANF